MVTTKLPFDAEIAFPCANRKGQCLQQALASWCLNPQASKTIEYPLAHMVALIACMNLSNGISLQFHGCWKTQLEKSYPVTRK